MQLKVPCHVEGTLWCAVAGRVESWFVDLLICGKMIRGQMHNVVWRKWENRIWSALSDGIRDTDIVYQHLAGCKEDRARLIWKIYTRGNGHKLEAKTLRREGKKLLTRKAVKHCSRVPGKLSSLPWWHSKKKQAQPQATCCHWTCSEQEVGPETSRGPWQLTSLIRRNKLSSPLAAEVSEIKLL